MTVNNKLCTIWFYYFDPKQYSALRSSVMHTTLLGDRGVDRYCHPVAIICICMSAFKHCSFITTLKFESLHFQWILIEKRKNAPTFYPLPTKNKGFGAYWGITGCKVVEFTLEFTPVSRHASIRSHAHSYLEAI